MTRYIEKRSEVLQKPLDHDDDYQHSCFSFIITHYDSHDHECYYVIIIIIIIDYCHYYV